MQPDLAPSAALWLIRHAQPLVAPGICYGASDIAADPQATRQAAAALAVALPSDIALLCSPLQRCQQLAQALQALRPDLCLRLRLDPRLQEMDFGQWEGQRWDAIPQSAWDVWTADFAHHRFGGAMCVADFMQRVANAWDQTHASGLTTAWITHAGVIRAAALLARGQRQVFEPAQWPREAPAYSGWVVLRQVTAGTFESEENPAKCTTGVDFRHKESS
jgi:alpha-ribazole phosphatase